MSTAAIERTVIAHLLQVGLPNERRPIVLAYDLGEPFTLTIAIPDRGSMVEWSLSREMVHSALLFPGTIHGLADVKLLYLPPQGTLRVYLGPVSAGGPQLVLLFAAHEVRSFVRQAYDLCPAGSEPVDGLVDATLARILGEGAAS